MTFSLIGRSCTFAIISSWTSCEPSFVNSNVSVVTFLLFVLVVLAKDRSCHISILSLLLLSLLSLYLLCGHTLSPLLQQIPWRSWHQPSCSHLTVCFGLLGFCLSSWLELVRHCPWVVCHLQLQVGHLLASWLLMWILSFVDPNPEVASVSNIPDGISDIGLLVM